MFGRLLTSGARSMRCAPVNPIRTNMNLQFARYFSATSPFDAIKPHADAKSLMVVLDLDETILHAFEGRAKRADAMELKFDEGDYMNVVHRPHMTEFLQWLSQHFTVALYTAGIQEYADLALTTFEKGDEFVPKNQRLYRHDCISTIIEGRQMFLKDLKKFDWDQNRILIVDNNPISMALQLEKGVLCHDFMGDNLESSMWKEELIQIAEKLAELSDPEIEAKTDHIAIQMEMLTAGVGMMHRPLITDEQEFLKLMGIRTKL